MLGVDPTVITALVAGIVAFAGGFFVRRTNNQSATVDVNKLIDRIAKLESDLRHLDQEVARLRGIEEKLADEVDERDQRIADLEDRVEKLELWIRAQGADPQLVVDGLNPFIEEG